MKLQRRQGISTQFSKNKNVSPSDKEVRVVTADEHYDGLGTVTVAKISPYMIEDFAANKIKKGEVILGVEGTYGPTSQVKKYNSF